MTMVLLVNLFLGFVFGWCAKAYTDWSWWRFVLNYIGFMTLLVIIEVALGLFEGGGGAE